MQLLDRTAVITGGTKGLGLAVVEAYLAEGCAVVCAARRPGAVQRLEETYPGRIHFRQVDIDDPGSVEDLMVSARKALGRLDILVANAGVSRPGPVDGADPGDWAQVVRTNLVGTFLCLRAAVPHLEPGGRVITMSSALATQAVPGASAYAASKAGIEALTKVAAVELAPRGITVNCLSPGFIDAGMGRELMQHETVWSRYAPKLAMQRPGRGHEVAAAAVWLAGPGADYVNGHVLAVDGGLSW